MVMDVKMTNDVAKIVRLYRENRARAGLEIAGGEAYVDQILNDFFSLPNTVLRLCLYKEKLNKSARKGEVPLFQFYLNMSKEERLVFMIKKSKKTVIELKPDE